MDSTKLSPANWSIVAYFGRNADGNLRCYCTRCNNTAPLSGARQVYGDTNSEDICDYCGASLRQISVACQADYEARQGLWSRGAVTHVIEQGLAGALRCKVF